ncbi:MAG: shikimate kinase [Parvibaculales bacterium]
MDNKANDTLRKTVVLVGMMGSGKSSIGRLLADELGVTFKDADTEIEAAAAMSIAEIFETHGEAYFRDGERRVIERLLADPPHILATGGGAFCTADTRSLIKQTACSVWLNVEIQELVRRVNKRPGKRPLLNKGDPETILSDLLAQRRADYAQADIMIASDNDSHKSTVDDIIAELSEFGIVRAEGA